MPVSIYYFSGTGNSWAVARDLALELTGELIPMAAVMDQPEIDIGGGVLGIVFPVYYGDVPPIVARFTGKLTGLAGAHLFAVATYGGGKGGSMGTLRDLVADRGGALAAAYGIHMPQNAFTKKGEDPRRLYKQAAGMVRRIGGDVRQRKKGFTASDPVSDLLQRPLYSLLKPVYRKHLVRKAEGDPNEPSFALIHRMDRNFRAGEACTGCGLCASVCPVGNIEIRRGKPVWKGRCENCIACEAFCPRGAIETGIVEKGYRYRHPDYSVDLARRQGEIRQEAETL